MHLAALFDASLRGRRDQVALEYEGRAETFGEIDARAGRAARVIQARGLLAGDRLAVHLPNSPLVLDLFLACLKTGVIYVPVNPLYREREVAHIVADAEPRALVTADDMRTPAANWSPRELIEDAQAQPADPAWEMNDDAAPAAIVYTSGTTGASKGAVLTRANFAANARNVVATWRITPADRFLLALPLFHVHGLANGVGGWLASGCRMRLLDRFDHARAPAEFLDFRPTLYFGVPAMYVRMLDWDEAAAREIGRAMRLFVSGSAPLAAQVLEEFRNRFSHTILERYGMSETLMNLGNPYDGERRAGTVGVPFPGVEVRLLDDKLRPVSDGETGEVFVRGPHVFSGYWRRPDATAAAFVDGWFRTGDLASRSPDGYYTLQGRRGDLIISGGFNIYPREIEEVLQSSQAVAEAAVVGTPDRVRGEVPVAYVVMRAECDTAALDAFCRERLASFKIPRAFLQVEKLPRTPLGKVQKHLLPKWEGESSA